MSKHIFQSKTVVLERLFFANKTLNRCLFVCFSLFCAQKWDCKTPVLSFKANRLQKEWVDMVKVIWEFLSKCPLPRFYRTQGNFTQDIEDDGCLLKVYQKNEHSLVTLPWMQVQCSNLSPSMNLFFYCCHCWPDWWSEPLDWVCSIDPSIKRIDPSIKRISPEYWLSILKILEYSVTVASAQSQKISQSKSPDLTSTVFYRQIKYNPKLEASNIKCWSGICLDYHTLTNIHAEYWSVKNSDSTWGVRGWMTHCWGSSGSNKLLHPSSEVPSSSHWNPFR